jgi:hypothetical protein
VKYGLEEPSQLAHGKGEAVQLPERSGGLKGLFQTG